MRHKLVTIPPLFAILLTFTLLTPTARAQTNYNYTQIGENFLTKLNTDFLLSKANSKGASVQMYANTINPNDGNAKSSGLAELWTEDNMVRALQWGTLVEPATFRPMLMNAVSQLAWYQGGCKNASGNNYGYGYLQGGTCYFDDNSQLGGTLMDVYLKICTSSNSALKGNGPAVLAAGNTALNYDMYWASQDAHGGVPQDPSNLGMGYFYMNVMVTVGASQSDYGKRFSNQSDITYGTNYFNEIQNTAMGLLLPSGLFRGSTQWTGGEWVPANTGPLPGDQASVIRLALSLYRAGDTSKLAYAQNLMTTAYQQWVAPSGATNANAVNGGFALVDALCQLYDTDGNQQWLTDAKSIIDYILTNSRDTAGWFPNGTDSNGDWNYVRTGDAPDDSTTLLTQSAAAAAILEFAYTRQN